MGTVKKRIKIMRLIVRAHWIDSYWAFTDTHKAGFDCSNCKNTARDTYLYCPNCGAKMDEDESEG